ncbi:DUF5979 domain-containing protein [Pseudactinotalea sp.]|uniref:DUF5979 domain-containing protein n=1 Tax=Pseudactinotalea sp. TaxID=1926260 RepID=UPI003B3BE51C
MRTSHSHARRRSAGIIGILALLLSAIIGASTATAAPPYATDATITSAEFTQDSTTQGSTAELNLSWTLPDHAATPAGLVVDLPPELQGRTDSFPMLDPDGAAMGQCSVTRTQLVCDFDDDYLAANPLNISGSASFWVAVTTEVTEETEVTYDIDGVEGAITVTPPAGPCSADCEFTGRGSYKWGTYDTATGTVHWRVVVKAPATGMAGGQELTVTDRVGPAQEITGVSVRHTDQLVIDGNGRQVPGSYQLLDPSRYTVSDDLSTVTLTTEQGYFYVVDYMTAVTDGGATGTYTNEADLTIGTETTKTVTAEVVRQGGGGSGSGTNVGRFSITKEVLGAVGAVEGITYSGTYEVTTPAGDVLDGTFEVAGGDTWVSDSFPRGSTVHLTEDTPSAPETVTWADPVFSENDLTLGSGTTLEVTLTNEATLLTGSFSVTKIMSGDGAAQVPNDLTFVVAYSYPAGAGFEAGSGELVVPADGTVVERDQLPAGAEVTLTEVTPDPIDGLTWGAPVFSSASVTVAAGAVVAVDLTNTATLVPPTDPPTDATEDPTEPAGPTDEPTTVTTRPGMPDTGADVGVGALIGALALIMVGATMLVMRRRQQH